MWPLPSSWLSLTLTLSLSLSCIHLLYLSYKKLHSHFEAAMVTTIRTFPFPFPQWIKGTALHEQNYSMNVEWILISFLRLFCLALCAENYALPLYLVKLRIHYSAYAMICGASFCFLHSIGTRFDVAGERLGNHLSFFCPYFVVFFLFCVRSSAFPYTFWAWIDVLGCLLAFFLPAVVIVLSSVAFIVLSHL